MNLIKIAIEKPVAVSVCVLLTVLFGLLALTRIPVQLTPSTDPTVISVTTRWEGASPQEIENDILREQEEKVKAASGLLKMMATANQGEGILRLEFDLSITKEDALREVSDKLREVPEYPDNVDEPIVEAGDPNSEDFIAWIVLSSEDPAFNIRHLQQFAEERIKPEFERVPGIAEINVLGGVEREAQVLVDPVRLAQLSIPVGKLIDRLTQQNADASAGQIKEGKLDVRVRSVGRFTAIEPIRQTLLSDPGQPVVKVKDVAEVQVGFKESQFFVRSRGQSVIAINAQREVGANVMQVMAGLKEKIAYVQESLLPQEAKRLGIQAGPAGGFKLEQVYDQTIYIDQAIALVLKNLWIGGVLAVLILLSFLRSIRSTIIIAIAIPVSVVGTFVVMVAMGRSLNVISLAGLAFAVGMVVDNAIVVLENIDRHRRLGEAPGKAALTATREVFGAVLASTLTTVAVFLPILLIEEEAGQLFRDLSLAVCAAVTLSLIVSITVIPAAANKLLARPLRSTALEQDASKQPSRSGSISRVINTPFRLISSGITALTYFLAGSKLVRPALILIMTASAIGASAWLMPPASYLPSGNRNLIFSIMFGPSGYNTDQQSMIGERMETIVRPYWEARENMPTEGLPPVADFNPFTGEVAMLDVAPIDNFFFVSLPEMMFAGAISTDDQSVYPTAALLNSAIFGQPGIRGFAFQMPLFRTSSSGNGSGIELELRGDDLTAVGDVAQAMMMKLMQRFGPMATQPDPNNFNLPGPEVRVTLKPVVAADLGIRQSHLNEIVSVFGDGSIIGDYLDAGQTIDLRVRAVDATTGKIEPDDAMALAQYPMALDSGRVVPLSQAANIERTISPVQIKRIEEQRAVVLQITLPDAYPLELAMGEVEADLQALRDSGAMPPSIRAELAGSAAKLKQVKESLLGEWTGLNQTSLLSLLNSRLFLALLVVYLLMAALFENWVYPLVILFSVPLATVGGFAGLAAIHRVDPSQQLDVLTMLGFVILIGVVVNNAILLVHQALNLIRGEASVRIDGELKTNLQPRRAIAEAVRSRVRPILMATMTSVGGMLPLVLAPGAGSELYQGLGAVVVGGLLVSTIFTLLLVPMVLSLVFDIQRLVGMKVGGAERIV